MTDFPSVFNNECKISSCSHEGFLLYNIYGHWPKNEEELTKSIPCPMEFYGNPDLMLRIKWKDVCPLVWFGSIRSRNNTVKSCSPCGTFGSAGCIAMTVLYTGTSDVDSEFPRANVGHQIFYIARVQIGRLAVLCVSVTHHDKFFRS